MKILITGISGYAGGRLLPLLLKDGDIESVVGLDVKAPGIEHEKLSFFKADVRSPEIAAYFKGVDVVVHLAFIVAEIKDKKLIYDINVNGTRNVLKAAGAAGVRKFVAASSVSAYGSHPDTPKVITEESPLRGNRQSYYAHTKLLAEKALDEFEKEHGRVIVTRLRPSIFCGAAGDTFFRETTKYKVLFYIRENSAGLPVVHEDDVAEAFYLAVKKDAPGAFNISAGNLSAREMSGILKIPAVGIPYAIIKPVVDIGYTLGVSSFSSHWVVIGRYPFEVSCEKAKKVLGWAPKHTPAEAYSEMVNRWKSK
jgi:UDP-glucose 4-epimerase